MASFLQTCDRTYRVEKMSIQPPKVISKNFECEPANRINKIHCNIPFLLVK